MKLYSVIDHFFARTYPCHDLTEAKEMLAYHAEEFRLIGKDEGFSVHRTPTQVLGEDGYVYAEIHTLDIETTEWDLEMWSVLQEANNL